jgi:hypothetical protein
MTQLEFLISAIDFQEIEIKDWTFKASAGASYGANAAIVETLGINTIGSNFLVISTVGVDGRNVSVSDRINGVLTSNTWTLVSNLSSGVQIRTYYSLNPQVGNNHTFRITDSLGGGYFGNLHILAFDGATTTPLNYETTSVRPNSGTYLTASISGIKPTIDKSLFILTQTGGGLSRGLTQGSNIIGSVWGTSLYNRNSLNISTWTWYYIQPTADSINVTFSYGTASSYMLTALNNYIR